MTVALRQPPKTYVPLDEKARREAAALLAETANGHTNRLRKSVEERNRIEAEAIRMVNRPLTKLPPQEVWKMTVNRVANMANEAVLGLRETLPAPILRNFVPNKPSERPIKPVANSPHSGLTMVGIIKADNGLEIQLYCCNVEGTFKVTNNKPELVDIVPSDEKKQNSPRYFGTSVQRRADGTRDTSPQLMVTHMTDINDVAARCCELFKQAAPTKRYEYMADKKARLEAAKASQAAITPKVAQPAAKAAPIASTAPKAIPAHQAHARSLWSKDRQPSYDLTIEEQRAARAAQMQPSQPEPARYAYGM